MPVTLDDLIDGVQSDVQDPDGNIFTDAVATDLVNAGIDAVSEVAPRSFVEDITPSQGEFRYQLLDSTADSSVEVSRVEIWDMTVSPNRPISRVPPASESLLNSSESGWVQWGAFLELPFAFAQYLDPAKYILKVWGYAPYTQLETGADETDLPTRGIWAVREYAAYQAYDRLAAKRALFTQWQTQANNADVSFAGLMNALSIWQQKWERRRKQLLVLREIP